MKNLLFKTQKMGAHKNTSKVSPNPKSTTLKFLLELDSKHNCNCSPQHQEILSLVSYCSYYIFTFTDPSESPFHQNQKRDKLKKLLLIIKPLKKPLPDHILSPLFGMMSKNLFRSLPPPDPTAAYFCPEDDDLTHMPTAAWPHLHLVYDILLAIITNLEEKTLSKYINTTFIQNMLSLCESQDPRERDVLKNAYHKLYSRLYTSRSCMRKEMGVIFLDYIYEAERRHCGIGDLLEILATIINGFSVPLKEEHRVFLMRVLVPLHRPKDLHAYHKQLAYCVRQFVEKEPALGIGVVKGILRYWPKTNCQKEVLLIGELEELVESMGIDEHKILAVPLCKQITKCFNSYNSQVAERALNVWNNEMFVKMATEARDQVFPIIVEGMERNMKEHWSTSVRQLTKSVNEMLEEMDVRVNTEDIVGIKYKYYPGILRNFCGIE